MRRKREIEKKKALLKLTKTEMQKKRKKKKAVKKLTSDAMEKKKTKKKKSLKNIKTRRVKSLSLKATKALEKRSRPSIFESNQSFKQQRDLESKKQMAMNLKTIPKSPKKAFPKKIVAKKKKKKPVESMFIEKSVSGLINIDDMAFGSHESTSYDTSQEDVQHELEEIHQHVVDDLKTQGEESQKKSQKEIPIFRSKFVFYEGEMGMEISYKGGFFVIHAVVEGGKAEKLGVKSGMFIEQIITGRGKFMQTGRLLRLSKGLRLVQRPLTIYMLESASSENLIQTVYNPNPSAHLKVPNMKAPPKRGVFKNEDEVMIFGLKTQKQYNGICAKILKCYPEKKAFKVQTELGRNMVSHNNLMLAHFVFDAGDEVKLHNLKNQNELNGSIVKVISFDEKEHKYVVQTKTGKFKVDSKFVTLHAKKTH